MLLACCWLDTAHRHNMAFNSRKLVIKFQVLYTYLV